jgi:hypothetical protein
MFTRQLPQKKRSCSHCVKSKRKCDLIQPKCGRCIKQDLSCQYPFAEAAIQEPPLPEMDFQAPAPFAERKLDFHFNSASPPGFLHSTADFILSEDDLAAMSYFDPPDSDGVGWELMANPPSQEIQYGDRSDAPFSTASLNNWSAARLLFAMDLIKRAPKTMVEQNQTPWSHPRLYDDAMPRCLSGQFSRHHDLAVHLIRCRGLCCERTFVVKDFYERKLCCSTY